jgi:putative transposase
MKSTFEGEPRGWTVRVSLTPEQEEIARRNIGAQRFAYNWAVGVIQQEYRAGGDKAIWSAISLRRRWYLERDAIAPWWAENSKEAYASGIAQAVQSLKNFQHGRTGKRPDRPRFPRFKKKTTAVKMFSASTHVALRGNRGLVLPLVGEVRSSESLRRFRRAIERGDMRITGMTLRCRNRRWYVSIKHRVKNPYVHSRHADPVSIVGVDLGVGQILATTCMIGGAEDGGFQRVDRPDTLKTAMLCTDAAQRRTKRRVKGSSRWVKAKQDASKASAREADIRKDMIHQVTSRLAKTHGVIVIEDLAVKAMARGWMKKAAARSGMGEFRRQVQYKGGTVLVADRFYASSKTCSACGAINSALRLSDKEWCCASCGAVHDRDENASKNLAQLGAAWMDGKTVPCAPHDQLKREPRLKKAQVLMSATDAH